jgi:hypothetical protein
MSQKPGGERMRGDRKMERKWIFLPILLTSTLYEVQCPQTKGHKYRMTGLIRQINKYHHIYTEDYK